MIKTPLFYMANAHPEIGRLLDFHRTGKKEAAENAKNRALGIVDTILSLSDVSMAGRSEWGSVKEMIANYENLNPYEEKVLSKFAEPFAMKFMSNYQI